MPPRDRLARALHALHPVPVQAPWNLEQLADLLPDEPLCPAAVLVGLREHASGTTVLLTRRQDALRHHGGQISFPGGRVDASDDGPLAAALRETDEEVGLPAAAIEPVGWLDPYATITGFHVHPLVARIDPDRPLRPNANEVAEAFEVPLAFLLDGANACDFEVEWRGRRRTLVEYRWRDYHIWGATAAMLVNLRERLRAVPGG